jgi:hypothetical protein
MDMTGRILGPGPEGTWYSERLSCPAVMKVDHGYLMWCYGSEKGFPGVEPGTVRFPMGRSGLFRSGNGAVFEPVAGPLAGGSVLGPSTDPDRFDTFQVGSNDVERMDGEYRMFHMGARGEVFDMFGARRQGLPVGIGIARSANGIRFEKHHGDQAGGAVVMPGGPGELDEWFCAFPRIVALPGGGWRMYYTGVGPSGHGGIGVAESADGLRWQKRGRVFGASGDPDRFDRHVVGTPHVVRFQGGFLLAYEALEMAGTNYRIGFATSKDGLAWERVEGAGYKGAGVDLGPAGSWNARAIGTPYILEEPDGALRLYHVGFSEEGVSGIGLAISPQGDLRDWRPWGA